MYICLSAACVWECECEKVNVCVCTLSTEKTVYTFVCASVCVCVVTLVCVRTLYHHQLKEAILDYSRLIHMNPHRTTPYILRGDLFRELHNTTAAKEHASLVYPLRNDYIIVIAIIGW